MKNRLFLLLAFCLSAALSAQEQREVEQRGNASYYAASMHGRRMASGIRYNKDSMVCAHRKYPFGTKLRVYNPANGREVIVKVTDRGPFGKKYVIDLSTAAARKLGIIRQGYAPVEISVVRDSRIPYRPEPQEIPEIDLGEENDSLLYEPEWQQDSIPGKIPAKNAGIVHQKNEKNAKPKTESTKVKTESTKPKAESTKPKAESTKVKTESTKVKTESTKLKAESTKVKTESTKVKTESTKVKTESTKLKGQS